PDEVYANLAAAPESPPIWRSDESQATTGVAWGDRDADGDLELAISQKGSGASGFYENTLYAPGHLDESLAEARQLPNPVPYVSVVRPGQTEDAYLYSSPERLAWVTAPTVTLKYQVYHPDSVSIASTSFEYSLDGGSEWLPATPSASSPAPITQSYSSGAAGTFVWDASADHAISDNARFRVRVVHRTPYGPVQRAESSAISPPFRVRGTGCVWPSGVSIVSDVTNPDPDELVSYRAYVLEPGGPGVLQYYWDFGDGDTSQGLTVTHQFASYGEFTVTVRVQQSPPCPVSRAAFAGEYTIVGVGNLDHYVYLPLVLRGGDGTSVSASAVSPGLIFSYAADVEVGLGVEGLGRPPQPLWLPVTESMQTADGASVSDSPGAAPTADNVDRITQYALGVNSRPTLSEDSARVAFWTTGRLTGRNDDGNIEIFLADIAVDGSIRYTQITSSTGSILGGFNLGPTIDDAGERIAFFSDQDLVGLNPDHGFEIYLAEIGGTVVITQVTDSGRKLSILPDISGDGRYIGYVRDNDIYRAEVVRPAIVTPTWEITHTRITTRAQAGGFNDQPSISEHGRFIAFVSDQDIVSGGNSDSNREIFWAEVGQTGAITYEQVTSTTLGVSDLPSISADGTKIAFISDRDLIGQNSDGVRQVFLAEYAGQTGPFTVTQLTSDTGDKDQPSISADGLRVAYVSVNDGRLHLIDLVEGRDKVEQSGGGNAYPAISANGTDIVYVSDWDVYRANYPLIDLAVSKTVEPVEAGTGDTVTFTVIVTNNGPSSAADVILTDVISRGLEIQLPETPPDYVDDSASE
ncbi:MAG: PKD domain-containing protein, partial [Anaerolineae bacterium]|nr:PKD domain-containing protein [Anaerolineae bacterium]